MRIEGIVNYSAITGYTLNVAGVLAVYMTCAGIVPPVFVYDNKSRGYWYGLNGAFTEEHIAQLKEASCWVKKSKEE